MDFVRKIDENKFERQIQVIDTHTAGEFTMVITGGFPELKGNTMIERMHYAQEHYDDIRTALMLEPRGHKDMFGALLTEPVDSRAQIGVIFLDTMEWLTMCGHGTIGCATAAVEAKLVPVTEPYTEIVFETPAGLIKVKVHVEDGKAVDVTLRNVPSFLYKENLKAIMGGKEITYDIAFGGNFFALVDVDQLGEEINAGTVSHLIELGIPFLREVNKNVKVQHPVLDITSVAGCEIYGKAVSEDASMRNCVVFGAAQADRSPCGTGTSAKLAVLHKRGQIDKDVPFVYESFIGTKFTGIIRDFTKIGDYHAIIPEITGSAYVTGIATYLIDGNDPLKNGFLIG